LLINELPRYEILDESSMQELERGWRRIVSELGVDFQHDDAIAALEAAGQKVEGQLVKFDPDWILEQVAKAPREFDLQARNPANNIHIGGKHMAFGAVYGCPFVRRGLERREATYDDFENLVRLAQAFPQLNLSPAQRAQVQQQLVKFAQCMRSHGIDIPDPTTNGTGGFGFRRSFGSVDRNSPAFQAANKACASLRPRFGRGGGGGGGGGAGGPGGPGAPGGAPGA